MKIYRLIYTRCVWDQKYLSICVGPQFITEHMELLSIVCLFKTIWYIEIQIKGNTNITYIIREQNVMIT